MRRPATCRAAHACLLSCCATRRFAWRCAQAGPLHKAAARHRHRRPHAVPSSRTPNRVRFTPYVQNIMAELHDEFNAHLDVAIGSLLVELHGFSGDTS